jgi:hypothetical protein
MFLFLHSATETNSSLIPLIKSIFDLDHQDFTDKFLLDTFTINLPGYDSPDSNFEYKDIENKINKHSTINLNIQKQFAQNLIFCKNQSAVSALKEDKINIIGHGVGAGIALEFATKNASIVSSIVCLSCAFQFSGFRFYFKNININSILKKNRTQLQNLIVTTRNIEDKKLASILLENPERKGFLSYWKLTKGYNFRAFFNRLSIPDQIAFTKIPILCLITKHKSMVSKSQIIELGKLINPNNNFVNNKHSFITFDEDNKSRFYFNVINNVSQNILEFNNLSQITNYIKEFLHN